MDCCLIKRAMSFIPVGSKFYRVEQIAKANFGNSLTNGFIIWTRRDGKEIIDVYTLAIRAYLLKPGTAHLCIIHVTALMRRVFGSTMIPIISNKKHCIIKLQFFILFRIEPIARW